MLPWCRARPAICFADSDRVGRESSSRHGSNQLANRMYLDIIGNMKTRQAVKALAALAQETRLSVFRALVEAGEEGMSAGDIAEQLDVPAATLSFHLKELAATELIVQSRDGRSLIYSLRPDVMNELLQFLMEDCCQGRPELCQPDFCVDRRVDGESGDKPLRRRKSKSMK